MTTQSDRPLSDAIKQLLDDARRERMAGNLTLAFDKAQLAVELARQCEDENLLGSALNLRGNIDTDGSEYNRAMEAYLEARFVFQKRNDVLSEARVLNNLANIHRIRGNNELAAKLNREAYSRFHNAGDQRSAAIVLGNMGITNLECGWFDQAETLLRDAVEVFIELNDNDQAANFLIDLAKIPMQRGQESSTMEWLRQALLFARKANNVKRETIALSTLGLANVRFNRWKTAIEILLPTIEQLRAYGDRRFEGIALSNLSYAYTIGGKLELAEPCLLQAFDLQRQLYNRRSVAISLNQLGTIRFIQGKIAEADDLFVQSRNIHREVCDSKMVAEVSVRIAETQFALGNISDAWRELHEGLTILRGIKPLDFYLYALSTAVEFAVRTDEYVAVETYWRELAAMTAENDTSSAREESNFASLWRNTGKLKTNPENPELITAISLDFPLITASAIEFELGRDSLLGCRITRLYEYMLAAGVSELLLSLPPQWQR